jgi:hypothetical protein
VARALVFTQVARSRGASGHSEVFEPRLESVKLNKFGSYDINLNSVWVTVDPRNGKVVSFHDFFVPPPSGSPPLVASELSDLAPAYLKAAGFGVNMHVFHTQEETHGSSSFLAIYFVRTYEGVQFHTRQQGLFLINRESGRLRSFGAPASVEPPPSLTPLVTLEQAKAKMIHEIYRNIRATPTLLEFEPVTLCIFQPDKDIGQINNLTPAQLALGAADKGILAYSGFFHNYDSYDQHGQVRQSFDLVVDALTGELLVYEGLGGGGGGGASSSRAGLAWDWGPSTVRVSVGDRTLEVQGADVSTARAPQVRAAGVQVVLEHGRLLIPAYFDAKSGLLWLQHGHSRLYGRPSDSLSKALRKLLGAQPPVARPKGELCGFSLRTWSASIGSTSCSAAAQETNYLG